MHRYIVGIKYWTKTNCKVLLACALIENVFRKILNYDAIDVEIITILFSFATTIRSHLKINHVLIQNKLLDCNNFSTDYELTIIVQGPPAKCRLLYITLI